jgi:hypothetical protein
MRDILFLLIGATLSFPLLATQYETPDSVRLIETRAEKAAQGKAAEDVVGLAALEVDATADRSGELQLDEASSAISDSAFLLGARFTLKQELASRIKRPYDDANNRTSFRMEYEKHFLDNFYLHFDVIETAFWGGDHRAEARGVDVFTASTVRDAYLQFSHAKTSIKIGRQLMIWGESDAGAITDVISPRNLSELFFISLEESRISQFMLTVDQFSPIGDWSFFYIPKPRFNQLPERGTAYFVDPFAGIAETRIVDKNLHEFGLRWKKTFGGSDFSVMAANLVDNDKVISQEGFTSDGRLHLRSDTQRFKMIGVTFNRATNGFLFSGEIAKKSPKAFLNFDSLQVMKKDVVNTSLRVEYSLGNAGNHAVSLEAVNKHVLDWNQAILPTSKNTNSMVLGWRNSFLNDDLSINWLTVYNQTNPSFMHSLFMNYKLNSRVNLSLDAFYLKVKDRNNELYSFRGQNKAVFRINYQF